MIMYQETDGEREREGREFRSSNYSKKKEKKKKRRKRKEREKRRIFTSRSAVAYRCTNTNRANCGNIDVL